MTLTNANTAKTKTMAETAHRGYGIGCRIAPNGRTRGSFPIRRVRQANRRESLATSSGVIIPKIVTADVFKFGANTNTYHFADRVVGETHGATSPENLSWAS